MLSRSSIHLVRALVHLAQLPEGEYAGAQSLAEQIGAPQNYLGKLLQTAARAGLVKSRKGLGGGFRLAREARSIRLLDAIEPIEPTEPLAECFLGLPQCSDDHPCALHDKWSELRRLYLRLLSETTVADILKSPDPLGIRPRSKS